MNRQEHAIYANKADRDEAYKSLIKDGYSARRTTSTNQSISPTYVIGADMSIASPNGFGGTSARYYAKLYIVEWEA